MLDAAHTAFTSAMTNGFVVAAVTAVAGAVGAAIFLPRRVRPVPAAESAQPELVPA